jgi:hypothetical protein
VPLIALCFPAEDHALPVMIRASGGLALFQPRIDAQARPQPRTRSHGCLFCRNAGASNTDYVACAFRDYSRRLAFRSDEKKR